MKIEEQVLSREQMAHLQELGIDTSDASMLWIPILSNTGINEWFLVLNNGLLAPFHGVPTYTIGDLIEKMPKKIGCYTLSVCWKSECVEYDDWISAEVTDCIGDFNFGNIPLIEALYDCLCWVAENHNEIIK